MVSSQDDRRDRFAGVEESTLKILCLKTLWENTLALVTL
jgi:hypothetical protein